MIGLENTTPQGKVSLTATLYSKENNVSFGHGGQDNEEKGE